jgi:hypothetical protein
MEIEKFVAPVRRVNTFLILQKKNWDLYEVKNFEQVVLLLDPK